MSSEIRWTIVVVVLAMAGVVALWPRGADPAVAPGPGAAPQTLDGPAATTAPAPDDAALAGLRARAALEPCPEPQPGAAPGASPLAGITVPCLGSPGEVDLATALAGKPAVLNLWASWCQPCRAEMPVLAAYATAPDAVPVIGINVQDRPEASLSLMAELGVHYPSVTDPAGELQAALKVPPVLPFSYVVTADGAVRPVTPPRVFASPEEVRGTVRRFTCGHGG
ncbi:MAG: TlpA family protein disulfide reductase [Pseudonocardiaceae bacterium]